MIGHFLTALVVLIEIYTLLCFIDILLSWFPGAKFTSFGRFIDSITGPYLNFFSRKRFFTFANLDFSPIISIGILTLLSSILSGISSTGRIYFGGILATVIMMIWNTASSLLTIFLILLVIRLIVLLINHGQTSYDSAWARVDQLVNRITFAITKTFIKKSFTYQTALITTCITIFVFLIVGSVLFRALAHAFLLLPF